MRIGIDIGMTTCDAVLMAGREIIATSKVPALPSVADSVASAVAPLLETSHVRPDEIDAVMVCIGSLGRMFEQRRADTAPARLASINAMLSGFARRTLHSIAARLRSLKISAPMFVGTNDGTLAASNRITRRAIRTLNADLAMAMRGAQMLSACHNAVVVNIGGSRTTIGVVENGAIRLKRKAIAVGDVRAVMPLPDVESFDIGGSTRIERLTNAMQEMARGAEPITLMDAAVAAGRAHFGNDHRAVLVHHGLVNEALLTFDRAIAESLARARAVIGHAPLVVVGGAASLVAGFKSPIAPVVLTTHHAFAGAIGVATAPLGVQTERIYSYRALGRPRALEQARARTLRKLYESGAALGSAAISKVEELPLPEGKDDAVRVCVTATGKAPG